MILKEDLYKKLLSKGPQAFEQKLEIDYSDIPKSFTIIVDEILDGLAKKPSLAKLFVLVDQAQFLDFLDDELRKELNKVNPSIEQTENIIIEGQKQLRDGDPLSLAITFWSAILGYAQHKALFPDTPILNPKWFVSILIRKE